MNTHGLARERQKLVAVGLIATLTVAVAVISPLLNSAFAETLSANLLSRVGITRSAAGDVTVVTSPTRLVSPDGKWTLRLEGGLLYRDAASTASDRVEFAPGTPLFTTPGVVSDPVWSPDGSRIAFVLTAPLAESVGAEEATAIPSYIGVYDVETAQRWYLAPSRARDAAPVWTVDGERIVFERTPEGAASTVTLETVLTEPTAATLWIGDVERAEAREMSYEEITQMLASDPR